LIKDKVSLEERLKDLRTGSLAPRSDMIERFADSRELGEEIIIKMLKKNLYLIDKDKISQRAQYC
jgi:hypothetical protein